MAQKNFGLERYTADQNSNKSRGYVPVVQRSRFQNLTPSPAGKEETPKLYHSPWVPVVVPGIDPRGSK